MQVITIEKQNIATSNFSYRNMSYSRRKFLSHLSLGLGSVIILPSLTAFQNIENFLQRKGIDALSDDEKLGIALVGLGNYSNGQLAPALQETKLCKLSGIVTGTPAKEKEWAEKYDIPEGNIYNYDNFDEVADNDDIDIIYVVLPNSMHPEFTIRAAEAGKHVICEKPMATKAEDCRQMIEACNDANVKLSIGYRLHFEPHNQEMMRLGQEQVYGQLELLEGAHSFDIGDPDVWRMDKELAGGGPLMDVGIYVIQGAIYTHGQNPVSVTAEDVTQDTEKFSEVEGTIKWTMEFPDGVQLNAESSYEKGASNLRAEAEDGWFQLEPAYSYNGIKGETSEGPMDFEEVNQQALQMDDFARCILEDDETIVPGEMGLRDVIIMEAIYEAAETGEEVQLDLSK